jgi:hypothetical protein
MFQHLRPTFLIFPLFILACASPKAPTGGPKDEAPPAIVEAESTPNKQTNFHEKEIVITFDEWVTLKEIYSQLVVSPPMPHNPEIKQKGKALIIKLPDSLRSETTYTINFGNSITDLNEGNVLENYAFIFSTGNVLDSLRLSGAVINAQTLKPADGVWVMLYPIELDSAVYKYKPDYVAKTNKDGLWSMSNIRAGNFQVFALKDENLNFLYDQETELFGWLDSTINTLLVSTLSDIWVFPREKRPVIKDIFHMSPGWMKVVVESPYPKPLPEFLPAIDNVMTIWDRDTLHVWYNPEKNYTGYAILGPDSSQIRISQNQPLHKRNANIRMTSGRLHPSSAATFFSQIPLSIFDTSRMILSHDSIDNIPFQVDIDGTDTRKFSVRAPWIGQARYNFRLLSGAVTDIWQRSNDSMTFSIVVTGADQYGNLNMTIDGLDSARQYVGLIKEGDQIRDTFVVSHQGQVKVTKAGLLPAKYTIEIFEDLNENGIWDTGTYDLRRQPERKKFFTPEQLRAGWDLEVMMTWDKK